MIKDVHPVLIKNLCDNKNERIRTLLITEGFGFCFSLSWVLGYELDKYQTVFPGGIKGICGLIIALAFTQLITFVVLQLAERLPVYVFESQSPGTDDTGRKDFSRIKVWSFSTIALIMAWLPIYLAYYPSVFSYDAEAQLSQVISRSYTTHHPLLHTMFMGWCMDAMYHIGGINAGMALYSGLQLAVMAIILGWSVAELVQATRRKGLSIVYCLFLCLFPVHGILAISTTKDVVFSGLLLVFVLLIRRYFAEETCSKVLLFKLVATTVMMLLLRNNAQYALFFMILWFVVFGIGFQKIGNEGKRRYRPWKLVAALVLSFILATTVAYGLKTGLHAESGSPREALSIPIQQLARVKVLHGEELQPELAQDLYQLVSDEAAAKYDAHLADPVKERISMKQPAMFVRTWIKLGLKFPKDYIDAWLLTTEGAWYIRDTSCNRIYGEGSLTGFGYLSTDIRSMPEGFQVTNESLLPGLRGRLEKLVSNNCFEKVPVLRLLFSPGLYFWIFMSYIYVCLIRRDYKAFAPTIILIGIYLTILMGPAILVRYMYPYMLAIILPMMGMVTKRYDYT